MVRQLLSQQSELRHVNNELDNRLDELAQANMRLYEMNRLKGDFLATVSHELRTPLNSIIGFSDVLSAIDALDEKQKRYVGNIQRSGTILLDMINDILDLAKMESGKMEVRLSEFKISSLVGAQCDMARPLAEKKNIDLDFSTPLRICRRCGRTRPRCSRFSITCFPTRSNSRRKGDGSRSRPSATSLAIAADGDRHRHRHQPRRAASGV